MSIRYIAASLLLAAATASSAAVLVVRSSGPSARNFPPGKSLDENGKIALKANDTIVVLDARGTRTLKGPGVVSPGGPAKAAGAMSALTAATSAGKGRARVGAVRSVGTGSARPNPWHVDVAKSSTVCVTSPAAPTFWRSDSTKSATMTLAGGRLNATRQLSWMAGQSTLDWPRDLPLADGVEYRLTWDGAPAPTRLQFRTLPTRPAALDETASSFIKNGCTAQLDRLVETAPQG